MHTVHVLSFEVTRFDNVDLYLVVAGLDLYALQQCLGLLLLLLAGRLLLLGFLVRQGFRLALASVQLLLEL